MKEANVMKKKKVYSRFRSPGWKVTGGIFLAGAMGIVLSIWTPEVQVAAQIIPTSQPAPTPGARVVTDKNHQGHGTRATLIR
jgi:hypothetical protein